MEAEVGVTGANFIIADTGSVAVTENRTQCTFELLFPQTHIVVVGIEKLIPSLTDLSLFTAIAESTFGTGQKVTVYNTIISGPGREGGPMSRKRDVCDLARQRANKYSAKPKTARKPVLYPLRGLPEYLPGV